MTTFRNTAAFLLIVSGFAIAQTPPAPSRRPFSIPDFNSIPRPPMPADPMELVTGDAQPVQDTPQRIAAIGLLEKARNITNIRVQP